MSVKCPVCGHMWDSSPTPCEEKRGAAAQGYTQKVVLGLEFRLPTCGEHEAYLDMGDGTLIASTDYADLLLMPDGTVEEYPHGGEPPPPRIWKLEGG